MRVLLTGASGFLGRHVLGALTRRGFETVCAGRRRPACEPTAEFIEIDLLATQDFTTLAEASAADALLHLAWYTEHGTYWTSPLNDLWADASVRLVDAFCATGGRRVVVAGTCAEYDWSSGCCREDRTPVAPVTRYGAAKDAARRAIMATCERRQAGCAWARVFLPFGAGEHPRRLIPSLIEALKGKRPPFGINAAARRDFLHAADVAEAFCALLRSEAHGVYNICSGETERLEHIVRMLAAFTDATPRAILDLPSERPNDPPLIAGDNTKLKLLGWRPELSFVQRLEQTAGSGPDTAVAIGIVKDETDCRRHTRAEGTPGPVPIAPFQAE
jgi:nucleoside-diphosphate-sugar epimerase